LRDLSSTGCDSAALWNDSRAWFITKWDGRCAGAGFLDTELLFAVESTQSRCLCVQLFGKAVVGWERQAICNLALASPSPDALITDMLQLCPALVSAGAAFPRSATPNLDKAATQISAIKHCIEAFGALLNDREFQNHSTVEGCNAALDRWRVKYNQAGTGI